MAQTSRTVERRRAWLNIYIGVAIVKYASMCKGILARQ